VASTIVGLRCGHSTNRRFDLVHDQVDRAGTQGRRLESPSDTRKDLLGGVQGNESAGMFHRCSTRDDSLNHGLFPRQKLQTFGANDLPAVGLAVLVTERSMKLAGHEGAVVAGRWLIHPVDTQLIPRAAGPRLTSDQLAVNEYRVSV